MKVVGGGAYGYRRILYPRPPPSLHIREGKIKFNYYFFLASARELYASVTVGMYVRELASVKQQLNPALPARVYTFTGSITQEYSGRNLAADYSTFNTLKPWNPFDRNGPVDRSTSLRHQPVTVGDASK